MQRYKKIVVGVDFSEQSQAALREAIRLAGNGGQLRAVHVIESLAVDDLRVVLEAAGSSEQDLATEAKVRLGEMVNGLFTGDGPSTQIEVVTGHPAEVLVERASSDDAQLLVLARNSTSDPEGGAGTCAIKCIRHATSDVLLVRDSHHGPFRRIMACVDFSAESGDAVERAALMAVADGATLHLVHAYRPPWEVVPFAAVPMAASGDYQTEHMRMLEEEFEQVRQRVLQRHPALQVQAYLEPAGSIGATLVAMADSIEADLVVVGTHGRGRIERLLLGSTAERVIRSAMCAVLTVRRPPPE